MSAIPEEWIKKYVDTLTDTAASLPVGPGETVDDALSRQKSPIWEREPPHCPTCDCPTAADQPPVVKCDCCSRYAESDEIESLRSRLAEAERFLNTAHALICQAVARRNIGEITPLPTHDEMRAWLMNYADRATVSAPAVCPECLGTGMGGTGGICRCKCGTNSASVTDVTTADKSSHE